jgi:hypothetical protein
MTGSPRTGSLGVSGRAISLAGEPDQCLGCAVPSLTKTVIVGGAMYARSPT